MKTKFLIPALLVMGMTAAPMMATSSFAQVQDTQQDTQTEMQQDKASFQEDQVQIEPAQLPQPVRDALQEDHQTTSMEVNEAWQGMKEDGTPYFKVKFNNGDGEEVVKKYDSEGKEIKDKDKDKKDDKE